MTPSNDDNPGYRLLRRHNLTMLDIDKPIRPDVLIDCDGVLADFDTAYWELANKFTKGGLKFDRESCPAYSWRDAIKSSVYEKCERVAHKRGFCSSINVYPGAVEAVRELREYATVHVVTSPFDSDTWIQERYTWLRDHFGFTREEVTFTRAKYRVHGDVLIEDWHPHLIAWSAGKPATHSLLVHRRYNRDFDENSLPGGKRATLEEHVRHIIANIRRAEPCKVCRR